MKGFKKLTIQVMALGVGLLLISFVTDTQFYQDYFTYSINKGVHCSHPTHQGSFNNLQGSILNHSHWNYRGWIYLFMGISLAIISIAKIITSHKEEDFK